MDDYAVSHNLRLITGVLYQIKHQSARLTLPNTDRHNSVYDVSADSYSTYPPATHDISDCQFRPEQLKPGLSGCGAVLEA